VPALSRSLNIHPIRKENLATGKVISMRTNHSFSGQMSSDNQANPHDASTKASRKKNVSVANKVFSYHRIATWKENSSGVPSFGQGHEKSTFKADFEMQGMHRRCSEAVPE
jgi:hypothetical protein